MSDYLSNPWFLRPDALAVLAGMSEAPQVESHEKRYVITADRWGTFTGPEHDRLEALWKRAYAEANARIPWPEDETVAILKTSPENVLGALFGDPNANPSWKTHRDESPEWAEIREAVANALLMQEAA